MILSVRYVKKIKVPGISRYELNIEYNDKISNEEKIKIKMKK